MRLFTRTIWILSIVSFLADIASEMLYPVIPLYLKEIGFTVIWIGWMEGTAEFVVGLSKGYFGKRSDDIGRRLPFVKAGYFLSAVAKSSMALIKAPIWVFITRSADRMGKGLRTAARDALLSQETTTENKAKVFGFHRSWDTFGAVLGPLLALAFLYFYPGSYTQLFYLAFIPGMISVAMIFILKEKTKPVSTLRDGHFFSFFAYRKKAGKTYNRLILGLLIFALANSTDLFLLLKAKEVTGSDRVTITAYVLYNFVYAIASLPLGIAADRWGMKPIFLLGLMVFMIVYTGFAMDPGAAMIYGLFTLYGIYSAATEGVAKAWITNLAHEHDTATALGYFNSLQSIAAFLSSLIAGLVWMQWGSHVVFAMAAIGAGIAVGVVVSVREKDVIM